MWYDSAEGKLAARGLIAESSRTGWRLLRIVPDAGPWPPATPPPVLAEGAGPDALGEPPALQPLAAFAGRSRVFRLTENTTITLQEGTISALARETPVALLQIRGPAALTIARQIAGDLQLTVPRASLPARAVALARGTPPPARRLGPPEITPDMSVADACAHAAAWLTDAALHWADRIGPDAGETPVHQMRVALRRLNTVLTVFRAAAPDDPAITAARTAVKAISAALAAARDWDVFLAGSGAGISAAFPNDARIADLLAAAARRRSMAYRDLGQYLAGAAFRQAALTLAAFSALRPFAQDDAGPGSATTWVEPVGSFAPHALDRRMKHADRDPAALDDAALHALRKDGKRLRYAGEVFTPLYPAKRVRGWQKRVTALQAALGLLNDSVTIPVLLEQLGSGHVFARGAVQGFAAAHARKARRKIRKAWTRLHRADPFWR